MNQEKKAQVYDKESRNFLGDVVLCILKYFPTAGRGRIHDLICFLEDRITRDYGDPWLALRYEIWARGPVQVDLLCDLTDGPWLLKDAIRRNPDFPKDPREFLPVRDFDLSDDALLEDAIRKFGGMSDEELDDALRGEDSLWQRECVRLGLWDDFKEGRAVVSRHRLDLALLLDDEGAREDYREQCAMARMGNAK